MFFLSKTQKNVIIHILIYITDRINNNKWYAAKKKKNNNQRLPSAFGTKLQSL